MKRIRLVVADDHKIVRRGTCQMLAEAEDMEVVGEAADGREALEVVAALKPDVLVVDLSMPVMTGIEVTRTLKAMHSPVGILMLSAHGEPELLLQAIQTGADGYLLKSVEEEQLHEAVRLVAAGKPALLQPEVTRVVMGRLQHPSADRPTEREIEILREVAKDLGNKQIATRLGISERTVQQHLSNIFSKLDVSSRTGAALRALQEGWISLADARG